jgi:peptide/nickel transport system permease protein
VTASAAPAAPGAPPAAAALPTTKPRGMFVRGLEVFLENKLAIAGPVILVLIFVFCFLGPHFYHTNQINTNLANESPRRRASPRHRQNGYDVLGRLMVAPQSVPRTVART